MFVEVYSPKVIDNKDVGKVETDIVAEHTVVNVDHIVYIRLEPTIFNDKKYHRISLDQPQLTGKIYITAKDCERLIH